MAWTGGGRVEISLPHVGYETHVCVCRAHDDDVDGILLVINESNRAHYRAIIPKEHFKEPMLTLNGLKELMGRMTFYVYRTEGKIVGVAALEGTAKEVGQVHWVYVLPGHQGRGVGTALLGHVEAEAVVSGIRRLTVVTAKGAHWARTFYLKLDYQLTETRDTPEGGMAMYEKVLDQLSPG